MFFIVAVTNSVLTTRLKIQKNLMTDKERRSNALYFLLKDLANSKDRDEVLKKAVQQIMSVFGFESVIFFSADQNKLRRDAHPSSNFIPDDMEWLAAESAYLTKTETGNGTGIVQGAFAKYFPLLKDNSVVCVIGVKINDEIKSDVPELFFLKKFFNLIIHF
jgi:K+-sensing histidine kinase KdpD